MTISSFLTSSHIRNTEIKIKALVIEKTLEMSGTEGEGKVSIRTSIPKNTRYS